MPITFAKRRYRDSEIYAMLRPYVAKWFRNRYGKFTPPQGYTIPLVKQGKNILVSSPTGTGKTLAVFLGILDNLYAMYEDEGSLPHGIQVVYVSPLRALNNDMRRNLLEPIRGIKQAAEEMGIELPDVKVAVRTSDTSPYEKQKMLRDPPHILITTPESLAIALNAPKFRERLKTTRIIVVDEIHELASSKRGSHLSLSVERLEYLAERPLVRIGLSATIAPLEEVAKFLVGFNDGGEPRDCVIVDARFSKPIDIRVIAPVKDLVHTTAEEINNAIYRTLLKLISKHRTTLVFTNTRSATERVVYKLRKLMEREGIIDIDEIEAHHSSLSRDVRLEIEEKLKQGKLRVVVCVSPETLVMTPNGWKKITDLRNGGRILGYIDGKLYETSYRGIVSIDYDGYGYEIATSRGLRIRATPLHRFLTYNYDYEWKTAEELEIGDRVLIVDENSEGPNVITDRIVAKEKVWIGKAYGIVDAGTGTYIANGFVSKNSSTSLELGIDIGYIDLVVLLSSPKSVSRLLQRIGRAGHHIRHVSKGRIIVVDRDDLVECTILTKAAYEHKIDRVRIPKNPLDVLAQHIVGMSLEKKWSVDEAYRVVRRSYTFHNLSRNDFINVLRYLSNKYGEWFEHAKVYSKIWYDEEEGVFGRKRRMRMIYYENIGTIPDEAKIHVFTTDGKYVGDLEEAFVENLVPGDLFVLGGRVYEFIGAHGFRAVVKPAEGARPTVPSWFSEMLPLSYDSALEIARFRGFMDKIIDEKPRDEIIEYLRREYRLQKHAAESIYEYIREQKLFTGVVPSDKLVLVEIYDEPDARNIIIHSLVGRRVNAALSRALAYIVGRELGTNVKITVTDNGFMLTIPFHEDTDWIGLFKMLRPDNIEDILKRTLRRTEMLKRRFRHCAVRSFMILRRYKGHEKSLSRIQLNAEELLRALEEIPDFPVLKETYREILEDYMHIDAAKEVLSRIQSGEIKLTIFGPTSIPSPFAHGIVVHGYSDVVLMEDMRRLLAMLHDRVIEYLRLKGGPAHRST